MRERERGEGTVGRAGEGGHSPLGRCAKAVEGSLLARPDILDVAEAETAQKSTENKDVRPDNYGRVKHETSLYT